jgi:hypothetical protein
MYIYIFQNKKNNVYQSPIIQRKFDPYSRYGTSSSILKAFAIPKIGRSQALTAAKGRFILDIHPSVAEFLGLLGAQ